MQIAIVGGTGTLGRYVAERLSQRGHEVRALSRHSSEYQVDLKTGEGLAEALRGCDVVVDASNDASKSASQTLVSGTERLLAAEQAAGVQHHVGVSIVGCEMVPMGYFQAKAEQERVVEGSPVAWSLVRATQFHEYLANLLAGSAKWGVLALPQMRLQTVAAREVAQAVADVAEGLPLRGRIQIAGPQIAEARDLAKEWVACTGRRVILFTMPLPGKAGQAMREGALTTRKPDIRGKQTFAEWLAKQGR